MSHTPGPWRLLMEEDGDETGGYGVDCWNGDIIAGPGGVAYEDICQVWPRDEANGRLIAAAPDLLSSLIALREVEQAIAAQVVERAGDTVLDVGLLLALAKVRDDADKAIAKAKGETA